MSALTVRSNKTFDPKTVFPRTAAMNNTQPLRSRLVTSLVTLAAGLTITACGGAQFERFAGSKTYRALPRGTPVKVVAATAELKGPLEEIGTLRATIKGASNQLEKTTSKFKDSAAKFGCDAVVGMKSEKREVKKFKTVTKMGAGGVRTKSKVEVITFHHDWIAKCFRTAEAPKEVPRTRRRRGGRKAASSSAAAKPGAAAAGAATTAPPTSATTPSNTAATTTAPTAAAVPRPNASNGDPQLASEVARAFLTFSKYIAGGNVSMICKMLDKERIYFDIRTKNPKLQIKVDLPPANACASLRTGELGAYLRDFGPAEVHAEIPTLVPSLFRIHGGAYLKLDDAQENAYSRKLSAQRAGRKSLACSMYTVLPAGNLFKISVKCEGVNSYRLLMRRDGANDFRLMAMTHIR